MLKLNQDYNNLTEEELKSKLFTTIVSIAGFVVAVVLVFSLFGTQVGALFGFISKNRNDESSILKQAVSPPTFTDIPKAINTNKTTLKGYANPGNTIKLFVNGPEKATTTSDQNGEFTFIDVELIKGRNSVFAKAIDAENNESEKSETHTVVYDNDRPELKITSPTNGDTIKNLNNRVEIKGTVNEKATITINDKYVTQKPDFSFEYLLGVQQGGVEIKVKATDEAGNTHEETIFVNYEKKGS